MKHVAVVKKSGMYRKLNHNSSKIILFARKSIKMSSIKPVWIVYNSPLFFFQPFTYTRIAREFQQNRIFWLYAKYFSKNHIFYPNFDINSWEVNKKF